MSIANTNAQGVVLSARSIGKYFYTPEKLKVLKDVQFDAYKGEFLTLVGKSGSGKSTLLYCLSTMDTDYEGDLFIDGERITGKHPTQLAAIRNHSIGFVFQFHYLLYEFSVLKNVMLPGLKLKKYSEQEVEHRAMERLKRLGIDHLALKKANQNHL